MEKIMGFEKDKPTLVLLCGLPGAGKTTMAKRLAEEMPAVRFCPDEWMEDHGISLWEAAVREYLEWDLFWEMTQELLKDGQNVVLEYGFWGKSEREQMRLGARVLGVNVELHYLDVPVDVLKRRLKSRGMEADEVILEKIEDYAQQFEAPDESELRLYNNHETAE
jgi:predicted kinase